MEKKTTHYSKQAAYKLPNNVDSIDVQHQRCLRRDLDIPIAERTRKKYFSLAALFALQGLELVKGDPEIRGQAPYYLIKHTTCIPLYDLEDAEDLLGRLVTGEVFCE
jgi:hypothetical protein